METSPSERLDSFSVENIFATRESIELEEFLDAYNYKIVQDSEKLFVREFLYPLLGKTGIKYVQPQYPFLDSEGVTRRIDFVILKDNKKLALEVNGETYHAEGIIPDDMFDSNLQRQNEIINAGWALQRYSYNQLQSPIWRKKISTTLFKVIRKYFPELIIENRIEPHPLQQAALDAIEFYRNEKGWKKGIVILPTGTGKTYLAALDSERVPGRVLYVVHRLDILSQSKEAFESVFPKAKIGILTGETKENEYDSDILFASKDTLTNEEQLTRFSSDEFSYIIIDEVHHGQARTYQNILQHFQPPFMIGLTATPDRKDRKDIFELFDYNKIFVTVQP